MFCVLLKDAMMIYERYVAIDNVCAWPNLTLLPSGDIAAVVFNQPCHGRWEGDVDCYISKDQGISWHKSGVVAPHDPGTVRMNAGGGVLPNGDMVYVVSGWNNMKPIGQPLEGAHTDIAQVIEPWVCRSTDGGVTWTHRTGAVHMSKACDHRVIPFGKIVCGNDGRLGLAVYSVDSKGEVASWVLRSDDQGQTWGDPVLIAEQYNETDLLVLPDGRWLAAARSAQGGHLDEYISKDDGQTWCLHDRLTAASQHPAHLLQLADGTVLLTYGIRHRGLFGIGARCTEDGEKWFAPMVVVNFNHPACGDGGYPSSVQLEDGTVVTAYYAQKSAEHHRYHVGVLRWDPKAWANVNTSAYPGF